MRLMCLGLLLGVLFVAQRVAAYDTDGHFYTMYLVARDSGFTAAEALALATMDEYTDWDPRTDAVHPLGVEQRRLYHFPEATGTVIPTIRNSPFAKHNINMALKTNDFTKLGVALHVYMDSFSHEGYAQVFGHLAVVHVPDQPYLYPLKFKAMVSHVYSILKQYRVNNGLPVTAGKLTPDNYQTYARYCPDYWWYYMMDFDNAEYEKHSLGPRNAEWAKHIEASFPGSNPVYVTPSGEAMTKFDEVVKHYTLPKWDDGCDRREWATRDSSEAMIPTLQIASAASVAMERAAAVSDEKRVAQLLKMPVKRAARFLVTATPWLVNDTRVQAHVVNAEGLAAVLDTARVRGNPDSIYLVISSCDWSGVDVIGALESRLASKDFKTRMVCAGLLLNYPTLAAATVEKLRAVYQDVADGKLSGSRQKYLAQVLPTRPDMVAFRAPATVAILQKLLQNPTLTAAAAAKLYLIGTEIELPGGAPIPDTLDSVRREAFAALRSYEGENGDERVAAALEYWTIRSYEDFDSAVSASASDQENLSLLAERWAVAQADGDMDALQSAAIALYSYDKDDAVSASLVAAVKASYFAPGNADIALDIGYAYEQMTGQPLE